MSTAASRNDVLGGAPLFDQVVDVVLEDEQIRLAGARDPDEGLVVVFDDAPNLFVVAEAHAHGLAFLNQPFQVFDFLESLLGRASPGFSALLRSQSVS